MPRRTRSRIDDAAESRFCVAFVDHCALLSGGELALSRLLPVLPVEAHVVLADSGPLVELLEASLINTTVLPMSPEARALPKDRVVASREAIRLATDTARYIWRLRAWIREHDVDLVHTNSLKAAVYGGFAGRLARVPVVWHVRDRIAVDYLPAPAVRLIRLLSRFLPTAVIANSVATMATLPTHSRGGARQHVLYDAGVFAPNNRVPRAPEDEMVIGIVGRLAPWKGQDVFLRAFAEAFPVRGRAILVGSAMFDEADYEESLHDLVRSLGIADRVQFAGFRSDVSAELAAFDIFVHASMIPEPFGQVIVEAMAAGVPVIASGAGGPREIITDGVDGLFHKPGDAHDLATAMKRLAEDAGLRKGLSEAALSSVQRFRPEKIAANLMTIYERTLA